MARTIRSIHGRARRAAAASLCAAGCLTLGLAFAPTASAGVSLDQVCPTLVYTAPASGNSLPHVSDWGLPHLCYEWVQTG